METQKWYQSKTIWGVVVAVIAMILKQFGKEIGAEDQANLVNILLSVAEYGGSLFAIYGRVRATKAIQ
jgi:hypothetical protein